MEWAGDDLALRVTIFAVFLTVIALLGIQGTWDEVRRCDLVVYLFLLVVIVLSQLGLVIFVATNATDFKDYLEGIWMDWSDARQLQGMESYECGVYQPYPPSVIGYNDTAINNGTYDVDDCLDPTGDDETDYCFEDCFSELEESITTLGSLTTVLLLVFAMLELSVLVCSCILQCNSVSDYEEDSSEYDIRYRL